MNRRFLAVLISAVFFFVLLPFPRAFSEEISTEESAVEEMLLINEIEIAEEIEETPVSPEEQPALAEAEISEEQEEFNDLDPADQVVELEEPEIPDTPIELELSAEPVPSETPAITDKTEGSTLLEESEVVEELVIPEEAESDESPEISEDLAESVSVEESAPSEPEDKSEPMSGTSVPSVLPELSGPDEPDDTGTSETPVETLSEFEESPENDGDILLELTVSGQTVVPLEGDLSSAGDLLDAYALGLMDALNRPMLRFAVLTTGDRLEGIEAALYRQLKDRIAEVAGGSRSSTRFPISVGELGLEKTRWTAKDLGLKNLTEKDIDGNVVFTREALDLVAMNMAYDLSRVVSSLLADCPYELYWYDKTLGAFAGGYTISGTSKYIEVTGNLEFCFPVVPDYSTGEYSDVTVVGQDGEPLSYHRLLAVDTRYGAAVRNAVANASTILEECADQPDYLKLLAYANRICSLADYNDAAATPPGMRYGNPWQIVWLFDGDPETTVVCESYAKGLQYLCDHSTFSTDFCCYCLMGRLRSENHMWNYVRMNDGNNYLVDLTRGDLGDTMDEDLFLVGSRDGSPDRGYRIVNASGTLDNSYLYSTYSLDLFTEQERTLSPVNYLSCQRTGEHSPGEPVREKEQAPTYESDGSYEEAVYCLLCGEELRRSRTDIPKKKLPAPVIAEPESTADGVLLRWEKVQDATAYSVYRKGPGEDAWQRLGSTDQLSWTDRNVQNGSEYRYMLRAVVGKAIGDTSEARTITYFWQTESETDTSQQTQKGPKTGDSSAFRLWLLLLLVSVEGLLLSFPVVRRSRR